MHLADYYYTLNTYYQKTYGEKVYKIAVDGGFTCPNRDGTLGNSGCIFCSQEGSGDFAIPIEKLEEEIQRLTHTQKASKFIVYFQSFTNTYGPLVQLKALYERALIHEQVVGIAIATRPDCLPDDVIDYLEELNKLTDVYIELGLQTIHEASSTYIRRGFTLSVYNQAVIKLRQAGINTIVHLILGLPGETPEDMYASVDYVTQLGIDGIKLQLLHILDHTDLYADYKKNPFKVLSQDDYVKIVVNCLRRIPKDIVIHRITGDGSKTNLIAPTWSLHKKKVLNAILKSLGGTMINHDLSINKLIILYLLKRVDFPLTNTQLSNFIIDRGYTNYFSFQEYLHQLISNDLIRTITTSKSTSYTITSEGLTTLDFFENRISESIQVEIDLYMSENKYNIRQEVEITSEYIPEKDGDYLVHLVAKENSKTLIDLTINVFDKDYAIKICDQWKDQSHVLYKMILNNLLENI